MKNKIVKEAKPTLKTFCVPFNDTCALSGEGLSSSKTFLHYL